MVGPNRVPASRTVSPAAMSLPVTRMYAPGSAVAGSRTWKPAASCGFVGEAVGHRRLDGDHGVGPGRDRRTRHDGGRAPPFQGRCGLARGDGATTRSASVAQVAGVHRVPVHLGVVPGRQRARGASVAASLRPRASRSRTVSLPRSRSAASTSSLMLSRCPATLRRNGEVMATILGSAKRPVRRRSVGPGALRPTESRVEGRRFLQAPESSRARPRSTAPQRFTI